MNRLRMTRLGALMSTVLSRVCWWLAAKRQRELQSIEGKSLEPQYAQSALESLLPDEQSATHRQH